MNPKPRTGDDLDLIRGRLFVSKFSRNEKGAGNSSVECGEAGIVGSGKGEEVGVCGLGRRAAPRRPVDSLLIIGEESVARG